MEREAVFQVCQPAGDDRKGDIVRGYDFNNDFNFDDFIKSFKTTGFTATALGRAIDTVKRMREWRRVSEEDGETVERCKIFLGYTSNQVSSGNRELIRYLCQHKMVDVVVSTAGGVEEDLIKCLEPTFVIKRGADQRGEELRRLGMNRIYNLIVPNDNYCRFEEWLMPILDKVNEEQEQEGVIFTPSELIRRLGMEIKDESSILYHCARNGIPVYCPALTDGSLGDMLYFHSYQTKQPHPIILDICRDLRLINTDAVRSPCTGMIILGGGLVKHHICNANLMRNGADFAVFINTGHDFDGSDAGASPDEAVSWGKLRVGGEAVKVCCDATIAFPLLVAGAFRKI